ncbi:hypothetical protein BH23PLA1_BH23PLA1_42010 [soil metagenome]
MTRLRRSCIPKLGFDREIRSARHVRQLDESPAVGYELFMEHTSRLAPSERTWPMLRRFALAVLLLGLIARPSPGQMIRSSSILPTRAGLQRVGLERAWFTAVPLQAGLEQVIDISLVDDLLFAQTSDAVLHAFEAESGRLLWSAKLGHPSGEAKGITGNSTQIFATNAQDLIAMERATGRTIWNYRLESNPSSPTAANENVVMVGMTNGKVVAYKLTPSEDPRFRLKSGPPGGFAWAWQTNGKVTAQPLPTPAVVAIASQGGKVYVAMLERPTLLHRSHDLGAISASMGFFGFGLESTLMVPSQNNNLYAINLFTGEQRWIFPTGAPILQSPLVTGDTVYVLNSAGSLSALDPTTGQSRWPREQSSTGASRLLAVGTTRIYMQSLYSDLIVVDRSSGQLLAGPRETYERGGLNLREYNLGFTNEVNDRIFLASPFGSLICLREIGAREPQMLRNPADPPFGSLPGRNNGTPTPPVAPDAGDAFEFEPF